MIDISLSYSSYTVEKKEEEEEEEVGASATIPPGFTYCCLVEVCLLAGSSRAMLCCVLSEHSPHTRRISEQPGQVRLYRLFPPRLPPMGAKRLDERGGDYYSSSLSLNGERERANKDAVRQKQGGRRCWGPGRILEVYTTLTKDDVQAPSLLGETLLSLSLSLSPGLDELHDSCCCVSKTIPCCCANASPVPLFIYLLDVARKKKKEEEKRGKVFGYLFELGPLSIFLIIRRRRRRRKRFLYIGLLLLLPRVDLMPSFPAAYREKRGQQSHFL